MTLFLGIAGIYFVSWAYQLYQKSYKNYQDRLVHQASLEHRPMDTLAHLALMPKYPPACQEVIVRVIARANDIRNPKKLSGQDGHEKTHQPVNVQITYLYALYQKDLAHFINVLRINDSNWSISAVQNAAKELVETAYVLSCLMLEDIDDLIKTLGAEKGLNIQIADLFKMDHYYTYELFYCCPKAYHWTRGQAKYDAKFATPLTCLPFIEPSPNPYYQKGTDEHKLSELFNDYCKRVSDVIGLDQLSKDHRKWIVPDTAGVHFNADPTLRFD
jgi:hypothetical protein